MYYELWDTETANMVECFDNETAALQMVREMVQEYGPDAVDDWALISGDESGRRTAIAAGSSLFQRATEQLPA